MKTIRIDFTVEEIAVLLSIGHSMTLSEAASLSSTMYLGYRFDRSIALAIINELSLRGLLRKTGNTIRPTSAGVAAVTFVVRALYESMSDAAFSDIT